MPPLWSVPGRSCPLPPAAAACALLLAALAEPLPLSALPTVCPAVSPYDGHVFWEALAGSSPESVNCTGFRCYAAEQFAAPSYELAPAGCDPLLGGPCDVRLRVPIELPGNAQNDTPGAAIVYWFEGGTPPPVCDPNCGQISNCGVPGLDGPILVDFIETYFEVGGVSQGSVKQCRRLLIPHH